MDLSLRNYVCAWVLSKYPSSAALQGMCTIHIVNRSTKHYQNKNFYVKLHVLRRQSLMLHRCIYSMLSQLTRCHLNQEEEMDCKHTKIIKSCNWIWYTNMLIVIWLHNGHELLILVSSVFRGLKSSFKYLIIFQSNFENENHVQN